MFRHRAGAPSTERIQERPPSSLRNKPISVVKDEAASRIERIKLVSIGRRNIEPGADPGCFRLSRLFCRFGVAGHPGRSSIRRLHGSSEVCHIGDIWIMIVNRQAERFFCPLRRHRLRNPCIVDICIFSVEGRAPDQSPVSAVIVRASHSLKTPAIDLHVLVRGIGSCWAIQAGCDCANLCPISRQLRGSPCHTPIVG